MSYSLPISLLITQSSISYGDFFPLVSSGSSAQLTTYRVDLQTLYDFFNLPQISCSWTSQSISSSYALSASYPPYPQISCSWTSQSISSSYALSASWAPNVQQVPQYSCSFASKESISSSYSYYANWAPQIYMPSMSFSNQSISSSYALTASWAPSNASNNTSNPIKYLSSPQIIRSFSDIVIPGSYNTDGLSNQNYTANITYIIPTNSIPYNTGIILQNNTNGLVESAAFIYVSSSVMVQQLVASTAHGNLSSLFFVNVGPDNTLYISYFSPAGSYIKVNSQWGMNIIGYY